MCKLVWLLLLVSILSVNAFVGRQSFSAPKTRRTQLFVSQPVSEPDEGTPGTVFGRPLHENTKERNSQFVHTIKAAIFDTVFAEKTMERSYARFWALEEIARMPYFSYLTALHFYETAGLWRRSDYLKIHFAETWNEQQ